MAKAKDPLTKAQRYELERCAKHDWSYPVLIGGERRVERRAGIWHDPHGWKDEWVDMVKRGGWIEQIRFYTDEEQVAEAQRQVDLVREAGDKLREGNWQGALTCLQYADGIARALPRKVWVLTQAAWDVLGRTPPPGTIMGKNGVAIHTPGTPVYEKEAQ
jgi:hypothetical protein